MKKLLLVLGALIAAAVVMAMIRSRTTGEAIPERWSDAAKDVTSNLSDSVKGAASAMKDKAAEATSSIKEAGANAADTAQDKAKDAVSG